MNACRRRFACPIRVLDVVVISAGGISCLEVYRYIYAQLRMATDFRKILMVFGDGRVGVLAG